MNELSSSVQVYLSVDTESAPVEKKSFFNHGMTSCTLLFLTYIIKSLTFLEQEQWKIVWEIRGSRNPGWKKQDHMCVDETKHVKRVSSNRDTILINNTIPKN